MTKLKNVRTLTKLDQIICGFDNALKTLNANQKPTSRVSPANEVEQERLSTKESSRSISLMRVNHTGEVCAQALYQGQGLTAKLPHVKKEMELAALEEQDHLAWCEQRISELGGRTSVLNPLWYGMSFSMGAIAGLISDKVSLGFVAATEEQVCQHLTSHLEKIPSNDDKSRAIIEKMLEDEARHAKSALDAGGFPFPKGVKKAMTLSSTLMTTTSYYI